MRKINITKTQKMALAVLVAAAVAVAALLVALPMLEPEGPDYAAVVDVKVYGPGWAIVAEDVGVDNATVLATVKAAGEKQGFETLLANTGEVQAINGTANDGNVTWHYGFVIADETTNETKVRLGDGPVYSSMVESGDVLVLWYTDDPMNNTPILSGSIVLIDVKVYGPGWTIICGDVQVGLDNTTALDALRIAGRIKGFEVETVHYSGWGNFVSGINNTEGDLTRFWLFGVNGISSDVGADSKVVGDGDSLVFWYTDDFTSQPPGA